MATGTGLATCRGREMKASSGELEVGRAEKMKVLALFGYVRCRDLRCTGL
jgi:hypothetical protein